MGYVVLDTETTGLEDDDQIIEIAIVDFEGNTLVNTRIKPTVDIDPGAQSVHGISMDDLADCPSWPEVEANVKAALTDKIVIIFNAQFDKRMLKQTARAFGSDTEWIRETITSCAMYYAAKKYGATNRYGTISLSNAVARADCGWHGQAHSALGDALTTLALYKTI